MFMFAQLYMLTYAQLYTCILCSVYICLCVCSVYICLCMLNCTYMSTYASWYILIPVSEAVVISTLASQSVSSHTVFSFSVSIIKFTDLPICMSV